MKRVVSMLCAGLLASVVQANWANSFDDNYFAAGAVPTIVAWQLQINMSTTGIYTIVLSGATNLLVNWGDSTSTNVTGTKTITNTYNTTGLYTLALSGAASQIQSGNSTATRARLYKILTVVQGISGLTSFNNTFTEASSLTTSPTDLLTNMVAVTDLGNLFS